MPIVHSTNKHDFLIPMLFAIVASYITLHKIVYQIIFECEKNIWAFIRNEWKFILNFKTNFDKISRHYKLNSFTKMIKKKDKLLEVLKNTQKYPIMEFLTANDLVSLALVKKSYFIQISP